MARSRARCCWAPVRVNATARLRACLVWNAVDDEIAVGVGATAHVATAANDIKWFWVHVPVEAANLAHLP